MAPKLIRLKCSDILTVLDVLQNYPIVWDVRLKEYSNKLIRDAEIKLIVRDLAKNGLNMDCDEFRLRLKNIKDTYRVELNKVKMSEKSGGKVYVPKLIWYDKADRFLREITSVRESSSNTENHSSEMTDEPAHLVKNGSPQLITNQVCISKHNQIKRKHDDVVDEAYSVLKRLSANMKNRDEFDIFGKHVACSIRNLKSDLVKSTVKYHITNILYQAEVGRFDLQCPVSLELPTSTQSTCLFTGSHVRPSNEDSGSDHPSRFNS